MDINNIEFEQNKKLLAMSELRAKRNELLKKTDAWALTDRTMSSEQIAYRQALRDLPSNSSPEIDENYKLINVQWPEKPNDN